MFEMFFSLSDAGILEEKETLVFPKGVELISF